MILRADHWTVDKGLLNLNAKTFALPHFDNIFTVIKKYALKGCTAQNNKEAAYKFTSRPGLGGLYSDSSRAGRSEDRIPAKARFSAPIASSPVVNPPYTIGTVLIPGIKQSERGVHHPPQPAPSLKKSPLGLHDHF